MVSPQPVQLGTARETFEALGNQFRLSVKVTNAILGAGIENLEEFVCYFVSGTEVKTSLIDLIPDLDKPLLQTACLRRAWQTVRYAQQELKSSKWQLTKGEDDDTLPGPELRNIRARFWARHKLSFPPECLPSDQLLSRVTRELAKRGLDGGGHVEGEVHAGADDVVFQEGQARRELVLPSRVRRSGPAHAAGVPRQALRVFVSRSAWRVPRPCRRRPHCPRRGTRG